MSSECVNISTILNITVRRNYLDEKYGAESSKRAFEILHTYNNIKFEILFRKQKLTQCKFVQPQAFSQKQFPTPNNNIIVIPKVLSIFSSCTIIIIILLCMVVYTSPC